MTAQTGPGFACYSDDARRRPIRCTGSALGILAGPYAQARVVLIGAQHLSDAHRSGWIMFIGPDDDDRPRMVDALQSLGLTFAVADDFHEAKRVLATHPPDLLITHLQLGAYNGLHLVLRGKITAPRMAAIVVLERADPVLEREARALDVTIVRKSADRAEWIAAARRAFPRRESAERLG